MFPRIFLHFAILIALSISPCISMEILEKENLPRDPFSPTFVRKKRKLDQLTFESQPPIKEADYPREFLRPQAHPLAVVQEEKSQVSLGISDLFWDPVKLFSSSIFPTIQEHTSPSSDSIKIESPKKRRRENEPNALPKPDFENLEDRSNVQIIPTPQTVPSTPESASWKQAKQDLAIRRDPDSPFVRGLCERTCSINRFPHMNFQGTRIYYRNDLFSLDAKVLRDTGQWETNLDRMSDGRCPVGHRGIITEEEIKTMSISQIMAKQRWGKMELQHMTQKHSEKDHLCEMTKWAHMSHDTNFVVDEDPNTGNRNVVYENLTIKEAEERAKENPRYIVVTNVLHFRKGPSLINRTSFRNYREKWWKFRATGFQDGTPHIEPLPRTLEPLFI